MSKRKRELEAASVSSLSPSSQTDRPPAQKPTTPEPPAAAPPSSTTSNRNPKPFSRTHALPQPRWYYIHLTPIVLSFTTAAPEIDELTIRMHLLSALSSYLGDIGASVPVDILKLSTNEQDGKQHAYICVPYQDGALSCSAVASWAGPTGRAGVAGYRILERGCWLSCLELGDTQKGQGDLFAFDLS